MDKFSRRGFLAAAGRATLGAALSMTNVPHIIGATPTLSPGVDLKLMTLDGDRVPVDKAAFRIFVTTSWLPRW